MLVLCNFIFNGPFKMYFLSICTYFHEYVILLTKYVLILQIYSLVAAIEQNFLYLFIFIHCSEYPYHWNGTFTLWPKNCSLSTFCLWLFCTVSISSGSSTQEHFIPSQPSEAWSRNGCQCGWCPLVMINIFQSIAKSSYYLGNNLYYDPILEFLIYSSILKTDKSQSNKI